MESPSGSAPEARTDTPSNPSPLQDHSETIESLTRRISTESLEKSGIKSFRILNEARLREVLDRIVEERVQKRLASQAPAAAPPPAAPEDLKGLRAEYRGRWDTFRARYEEKLLRLEEIAARTGDSPRPGK